MNTYLITTSTQTKTVQAMTICLACAKFKALTRGKERIIKAEKIEL
jgi:hypothetical protein